MSAVDLIHSLNLRAYWRSWKLWLKTLVGYRTYSPRQIVGLIQFYSTFSEIRMNLILNTDCISVLSYSNSFDIQRSTSGFSARIILCVLMYFCRLVWFLFVRIVLLNLLDLRHLRVYLILIVCIFFEFVQSSRN